MAVLRYYLNYDNDEDFARGLLILFFPFRNEMDEIHRHDVKQLLYDNTDMIQRKRNEFEKYKLMTDLISNIQAEIEADEPGREDQEDLESENKETETAEEVEDFNTWAKNQAMKDLALFKRLTDLCDMNEFRSNISSLNQQQRKLFDDFTERIV